MDSTSGTNLGKPLVLYALPNADGHMYPALQITEQLVSRGLDVTVIAASKWEPAATSIGAHFAPLRGLWARDDFRDSIMVKKVTHKTRLKALRDSIGDTFVSMMWSGYFSVTMALGELRHRLELLQPGAGRSSARRVIILSDMCFTGVLPFRLGANPFPEISVRTVCIALLPRAWATPETPCWGAGLPWDPSEQGVRRNTAGNRMGYDDVQHRRLEDALFMCGCTRTLQSLMDEYEAALDPLPAEHRFQRSLGNATYCAHDATFQMCIPSVEYPASNLPAHFKFGGQLPPKPLPADLKYPEWWSEVLDNSSANKETQADRKKIVFVAQGTESPDHGELVVPAIQALAPRDDVLVVACLCKKGAELAQVSAEDLPPNTRIIDFFPYDAVLPHADVFVSSSGYGGLNHAVVNGVPVVQTGILIDKPDVGRRIEYAGMGTYIPEFPPTADLLADAVERVLSDGRYKKRALELRAEAETFKPFDIIESEIMRLSA